jgi:hypothetical protein
VSRTSVSPAAASQNTPVLKLLRRGAAESAGHRQTEMLAPTRVVVLLAFDC